MTGGGTSDSGGWAAEAGDGTAGSEYGRASAWGGTADDSEYSKVIHLIRKLIF